MSKSAASAEQSGKSAPAGAGRPPTRPAGRRIDPRRGGQTIAADPAILALRRAARRPELKLVVRLVSEALGVEPALLFHASRCKAEIAAARQLAMYLMNVDLRFTFTEIGALFGRDRTTVRHACARIEDRRDDPDEPRFEAEVSALEAAIGRAFAQADARRAAL